MSDSILPSSLGISPEQLEERNRPIIQSFNLAERILFKMSCQPAKAFRLGYEAGVSGEWSPENALAPLEAEFSNFAEMIRDKQVMDYGCGDGFQSIALAKAGSSKVFGLDINPARLEHARRMAEGIWNVSFGTRIERDDFDVVISQNAFEHFPDPANNLREMVAAVRPGGRVLITFGPLWLSPYGAHMYFFTRCPWVNILFSETTIYRVRSLYRDDGAMTFFPGLNKMTVRKFERLVRESGAKCLWRRYHTSANLPLVSHIPALRELLIKGVSCILTKDR